MIRGFRDSETERVFSRETSRKLPQNIQRTALRKLLLLDAAEAVEEMRVPPGNRLEKLSGTREGQYSVRINEQWRICFTWEEGGATNVEIVDYH